MNRTADKADDTSLVREEGEYNASDPAQVNAREKKSKERYALAIAGLKFVMSTKQGRAYMRHLLADKLFTRVGSQLPPAIFTGSSATFYNAALREMGDQLAAEVAHHCPKEMQLMEDEGRL